MERHDGLRSLENLIPTHEGVDQRIRSSSSWARRVLSGVPHFVLRHGSRGARMCSLVMHGPIASHG